MPHLVFKEHDPRYREAIQGFLASQDQLQADLIRALAVDEATIWTHYRWLQGWDLLSLFIALTDPADRPELLLGVLPLWPGGPEAQVKARGAGPGLYTVEPWPFLVEEIPVTLPARSVEDRIYQSDADFQQAFGLAVIEELRVTLRSVRR